MTADQNPFLTEPPDVTAAGPSYRNDNPAPATPATVRISEDQIQHIIHELSLAQSSRSSGDSASSVNDQTLVPHISSVFETMSQFKITLSQLVHDVNILNGRVFHHNENSMDKILKEINFLKGKIENFETKADWVEHQTRTNVNQTRDATNAVDHWSASLTKLIKLVETHIALSAASAPGASFFHPHLWSPPPQQDKSGPSSSVQISSDDDEK